MRSSFAIFLIGLLMIPTIAARETLPVCWFAPAEEICSKLVPMTVYLGKTISRRVLSKTLFFSIKANRPLEVESAMTNNRLVNVAWSRVSQTNGDRDYSLGISFQPSNKTPRGMFYCEGKLILLTKDGKKQGIGFLVLADVK